MKKLVDLIRSPELGRADFVARDQKPAKRQVQDFRPTRAVVSDMRAKLTGGKK